LGDDGEGFGIEEGRGFPILELLFDAGREEEGEAAAFRSQPEPFLSAKDMDVAVQSGALILGENAEFYGFAADPSESMGRGAFGGGCHDAALPCGRDGEF